jgi:signal peptidase I
VFGLAVRLAILAAVLVGGWMLLRTVADPSAVGNASMAPTLAKGDHVLIDRVTLRVQDPTRFELVAVHRPLPHGKLGTQTYLRRIVGMPGDTLWEKGGHIWVKQAGTRPFTLAEPYVLGKHATAGRPFGKITIPLGFYFVLGDNRAVAYDSRQWGLEPRAGIIGVVRLRYSPLSHFGLL